MPAPDPDPVPVPDPDIAPRTSPAARTVSTSRPGYAVVLAVVLLLAAAMLRAPFVAVAPIAGVIGAGLQVGPTVVGLLTSIPVLCFAVCSPLAIAVIRRGGADFALTVTLAGAIVGCLVRSAGGVAAALVGTAIMGAFFAIGNIVIPVIINRDYARNRVHLMTGLYTSAFNVGSLTVTISTVPLANAIGWRGALLFWAVFGLAAVIGWVPLRGLRAAVWPAPGAGPDDDSTRTPVTRQLRTWLLAATFSGQAFGYYAVTAWLPTLLVDEGYPSTTASAIAAVFQFAGIGGNLLVPLISARASLRVGVLAVGLGWLVVPLGFLFAPALWPIWCIVGGMAQGGGITMVFLMLHAFGDDPHTAAGRSGIVQGIGYAVAAAGPIALGALHQATNSWTLPLVVVLVAVVVYLAGGLIVSTTLRRRGAHDPVSNGHPV
jgi:CP family cyanate transporter-like MFS transporter